MKKILHFILLSFCLIFFFGLVTTAYAEDVDINETNFPDSVFRNYVSMNYDTDSDGKLSESEISITKFLHISGKGITSLKGIEFFTELVFLECDSNQLTSLDVSNNSALNTLTCSSNQLTSLDVSNNTALTILSCDSNQLTSLNVNNTALKFLHCDGNQLTSLDVSNNTAL